ncbi:OpgC family protein [Flexibacterium corallicola]|uniref:OpgC family protein n=1 Tax=Flexibacterium corallicola TaxID=3037259 RepID=UPI00286F524C|nr:OpgC domain-containing protein [Pseudovibrio sp. M1P-2-3]
MNQLSPHAPTVSSVARQRDPRLDFFRGIAMFVIFIAHLPNNDWTLWIPARFGFSDATEIFVFCSGMASAIAFGGVFEKRGYALGCMRVSHRVWQIYWSHICLFLALAGLLAFIQINGWVEFDYVGRLNLWNFFQDPIFNLPGLLSLSYVPNYFDILPMYMVILLLMPLVIITHDKAGNKGAIFLCLALWMLANLHFLDLPAEPWSDRPWFFNPFGWQLLFFTGFAWMRGWIPPPVRSPRLLALCLILVFAAVPFSYFRIFRHYPDFLEMARTISPLTAKTEFGIFRYIHFLCLAYLSWMAVGIAGNRLISSGLWGKVVLIIQRVGQQSLAVFLASLFLAQLIAIARDTLFGFPANILATITANLIGFLGLIGVAYLAKFYKSLPWKQTSGRARQL